MKFPLPKVLQILSKEVAGYAVPIVDLIAVQTKDPYKILVATILSARTKDETTAKAAARLFKEAPTLAALALFAEGKTVIRNVSHLRIKESDRLHGLWQEWTRLGARIEERPDGLIITGNVPLRGTCLDPHDDHRLAMSLAVVGLKVPGLQISDESCVQKSFPRLRGACQAIAVRGAPDFTVCT